METMPFRADLHIHTLYSDGALSPEELFQEAKRVGLSALSITDHDSVAAYEEALPLAETYQLGLISGVEFSAMLQKESVHILGYSFSLQNPRIHSLCHQHRVRRSERNTRIVHSLKKLGITLEQQDFIVKEEQGKTWGRPHIAQALMEQGIVSSIQEAFERYLGEGKSAYDPGEPISVQETIETIHAAGGVAILAHPHLIKNNRLIKQLLGFDFDGLEGYYARLPPEQEKKWLQLAKERRWLVTGGSDYHGSVKPYSQLGSSWVNEETFRFLYERFCTSQARENYTISEKYIHKSRGK